MASTGNRMQVSRMVAYWFIHYAVAAWELGTMFTKNR